MCQAVFFLTFSFVQKPFCGTYLCFWRNKEKQKWYACNKPQSTAWLFQFYKQENWGLEEFNLCSVHRAGNKELELKCCFFYTLSLVWKRNKNKVQILALFLIVWDNWHVWNIAIHMDYLDGWHLRRSNFFNINLFIDLFLAALGLRRCA